MMSRPTQSDIARAVGVSQATVSLVLNDRRDSTARLPEETRSRVLAALKRAGYVANPIARSLSGYRSNMIGLFTFESIESHPEGFYQSFVEGIMAGCEAASRDLLYFTSTSRNEKENHIYLENENRLRLTDGTVLLGNGEPQLELGRLREERFPFVFIGRREVDGGKLSWVAPDYTSATERLVERLIGLGHQRIVYVGVGLDAPASRDRRLAYGRALRRHGLQILRPTAVRDDDYTAIDVSLATGATAFIVEPPVGLSSLISRIELSGRSVPADVSVAVMGDPANPEPRVLDWSGYRLPKRELGTRAVEVLLQLIAEPGGAPIQLEFECLDMPGSTLAEAR